MTAIPSPSGEQPPAVAGSPDAARSAATGAVTPSLAEPSTAVRQSEGTSNPPGSTLDSSEPAKAADGSSARAEPQAECKEETNGQKGDNEENAKKEREKKNVTKKPREQYSCVECFR